MRTHTLLGRDREITVLHDLVDRIDERGRALVVRGEAGIGKSALLADARAHAKARGVRILTVTGVQTEATLPFGLQCVGEGHPSASKTASGSR